MKKQPYYLAYEERYRKVFEAGIDRWGHPADDEALSATLAKWVDEHNLAGKKVIEFACGEGAAGVILSRLGCIYHGVDIAPSAVKKTREALKDFPGATVSVLDMVRSVTGEIYDAALDVMGLHMLVTDADRGGYLKNACKSLKPGAPMLFFRECYNPNAYEGQVDTLDEWIAITGSDYITPEQFSVDHVEVSLPILPARSRGKEGYIAEIEAAGFIIDVFREMEPHPQYPRSATIFTHKP